MNPLKVQLTLPTARNVPPAADASIMAQTLHSATRSNDSRRPQTSLSRTHVWDKCRTQKTRRIFAFMTSTNITKATFELLEKTFKPHNANQWPQEYTNPCMFHHQIHEPALSGSRDSEYFTDMPLCRRSHQKNVIHPTPICMLLHTIFHPSASPNVRSFSFHLRSMKETAQTMIFAD